MEEYKPNCDIKPFIEAADTLATFDDVAKAIELLDSFVPAYFRDHPTKEMLDLKNKLMSKICTADSYAKGELKVEIDKDDKFNMRSTLRFMAVFQEVSELNRNSIIPHIIDYGPGNFFIPTQLSREGLKFKYTPICISDGAEDVLKSHLPEGVLTTEYKKDELKMFLGFEIIEHLWNEVELRIQSLRGGKLADIIHISTPLYSFENEALTWENRDMLGHLRAYSPKEFYDILAKIFPEYEISLITHKIMHARLALRSSNFQYVKDNPNLIVKP